MSKISNLVLGAAAVAAALPALAGGEAGRLTQRDLGEKYVGYTTQPGDTPYRGRDPPTGSAPTASSHAQTNERCSRVVHRSRSHSAA